MLLSPMFVGWSSYSATSMHLFFFGGGIFVFATHGIKAVWVGLKHFVSTWLPGLWTGPHERKCVFVCVCGGGGERAGGLF